MSHEIANNPSPEKLAAEAQAMFDVLVGARKALLTALPLLPPDNEAVYCGEWLAEINEVLGRLCGWGGGSPDVPGAFKVTRDSAGQLHSFNDQPADIHGNGSKFWYKHGKYHRDNDLPAFIHGNGSQYWYQDGEPHRDNGKPAIVLYDGTKQYWVKGKRVEAPESETFQPTTDERRASCLSYGVRFELKENGWFALHNVAGALGPFDDEVEAVEVTYNTWVR